MYYILITDNKSKWKERHQFSPTEKYIDCEVNTDHSSPQQTSVCVQTRLETHHHDEWPVASLWRTGSLQFSYTGSISRIRMCVLLMYINPQLTNIVPRHLLGKGHWLKVSSCFKEITFSIKETITFAALPAAAQSLDFGARTCRKRRMNWETANPLSVVRQYENT